MSDRTRTVAYLRVSTDKQADRGVSLEAQRAKVPAYADLYELELVEIIEDGGASAKSLEREGLMRALAMLESGEADALLVAKLDRLTRSVRDLDTLIRQWFGPEDGPALLSVAEQIDTRSASGRLVLRILASVSEWEREAIGERTAAALAHKAAKGERVGSVPFGFKLAADGKQLVAHSGEQKAIMVARRLREDGVSLRGIARELDRAGHRSRNGRVFAATQIRRMVA